MRQLLLRLRRSTHGVLDHDGAGYPSRIKGVQYRGHIVRLSDEAEHVARSAYHKRFPIARKVSAPLWEIQLDEVKMTDNALGFGKKIAWVRQEVRQD